MGVFMKTLLFALTMLSSAAFAGPIGKATCRTFDAEGTISQQYLIEAEIFGRDLKNSYADIRIFENVEGHDVQIEFYESVNFDKMNEEGDVVRYKGEGVTFGLFIGEGHAYSNLFANWDFPLACDAQIE